MLETKRAAIRAGYAAKAAEQQGYQLLQHPSVAAALAERMERRSEQTGIDAAWVLSQAVLLYEQAMAAGTFAPAKGALDLIGKHVDVQAFRDQHEHRLMTVDEARKVIVKLAPRLFRSNSADVALISDKAGKD